MAQLLRSSLRSFAGWLAPPRPRARYRGNGCLDGRVSDVCNYRHDEHRRTKHPKRERPIAQQVSHERKHDEHAGVDRNPDHDRLLQPLDQGVPN